MLFEIEPLYFKWARWCWHKPLYIGLPLILGVVVLAIADTIYAVYWVIRHWGKDENKKKGG